MSNQPERPWTEEEKVGLPILAPLPSQSPVLSADGGMALVYSAYGDLEEGPSAFEPSCQNDQGFQHYPKLGGYTPSSRYRSASTFRLSSAPNSLS